MNNSNSLAPPSHKGKKSLNVPMNKKQSPRLDMSSFTDNMDISDDDINKESHRIGILPDT